MLAVDVAKSELVWVGVMEASEVRAEATPERRLESRSVAVALVAAASVGAAVMVAESAELVRMGMRGTIAVSEELALELVKVFVSDASDAEELSVALASVTVGRLAELVITAEG